MTFNGNLAWQQAVAAVGAHRAVLVPVAGVFFLLPALIGGFFLADVQAAMLANPALMAGGLTGDSGKIIGIGFLSGLIQATGTMALLALLTDRNRPTVAEAIGLGLRALPTLIAAAMLSGMAFLLAVIVLSMLAGLLTFAAGTVAVSFVVGVVMIVAVAYGATKLSLLLPVIVIDRVFNPLAALVRSWRLTRGHSVRLFFFYLLLLIAYLVIAIVFGLVLSVFVGGGMAAMTGGAAQTGAGALLAMSLVSGLMGAAASVLLTAILAAIHHQLRGAPPETVSATFE
jgi:hypothetical protein